MVTIRQASPQDAAWLQEELSRQMGPQRKPPHYFEDCCRLQQRGELVLLVAAENTQYRGHVKVVWHPTVPFFRDNSIPEIQDLLVVPEHRRKGIATHLLDKAETVIRRRSNVAGICFGLYRDYGPAQRMYVLRGYVPDGNGIVYKDEYVIPEQTVPVDDDLVLCLVKQLR